MSWDVMIHAFDGEPPPVEDLSDDFRFPPLGDAAEVRDRISAALPSTDWTDPAWGILEAEGYSIEFNFQKDGQVDGFMLHIRGGGDPVSAIATLCKTNGWVAVDTTTGEFMNLDAPSGSPLRELT